LISMLGLIKDPSCCWIQSNRRLYFSPTPSSLLLSNDNDNDKEEQQVLRFVVGLLRLLGIVAAGVLVVSKECPSLIADRTKASTTVTAAADDDDNGAEKCIVLVCNNYRISYRIVVIIYIVHPLKVGTYRT
jgi:hypothetical protein